MSKLRVLDFFAGIGAFDSALDRLGVDYELVDAVEIDKHAMASFNAVHGTNFECQDITKWDKDVGHIDIMWQSSPCQDISTAGRQAGADKGSGSRSSLVWEAIRIAEKIRPAVIIWENVKGLTTKKHKHILDEYISELEKLGYKSCWKVLNSKNFCIPQNRDRCYTVSILNGEGYEFPHNTFLTKRLKDVLESSVDEKYYLSEERLAKIKLWDTRQRENGRGFRFDVKNGNDIARTVTTSSDRPAETTYVKDGLKQVAQIYGFSKEPNPQAGRVYDKDGISPTLDTCSGGNRMPKVAESKLDFNGGAQAIKRRRTELGKKLRKAYENHEIPADENMRENYVADDGIMPTLTCSRREQQIAERFIVASRGRNLDNPSDKTAGVKTEQRFEAHRDGVSNTLTTVQKDNYVAEPGTLVIGSTQAHAAQRMDGISTTLTAAMGEGGGHVPMISSDPLPSVGGKALPCRIRKLTPKECWRLQGFTDEEFAKASNAPKMSNTALYKQAGNSVTVSVIVALLSQLGVGGKKWNKMSLKEREALIFPEES